MSTHNTPSLWEAFSGFLSEGPGRYLPRDMERIIRRFEDLLSSPQGRGWPLSDLYRLDEAVLSSRGDKQRSAALVLAFYKYVGIKYNLHARSELTGIRPVDNTAERQIEMIKYLHLPRSTQEVAEHFGLEQRTVRKDLSQLAGGTTFLGVELAAEFSGREHKYRSSLHPVFLVLSLSQAYAATVGLLKLAQEGSSQHDFYLALASQVFRQLSDYAKSRLREQSPQETARLEQHQPDPVPEWESHRLSKGDRLMYLFKSGEPATVSVLRGGLEQVYEGARLCWKGGETYTVLPGDAPAFDVLEGDVLSVEDFAYR